MIKIIFALLLIPVSSAVPLTQCFPDVQKTTLLNPILRRSSGCSIDNYQPISFLLKVSDFLEFFAFTCFNDTLKNKLNPNTLVFSQIKTSRCSCWILLNRSTDYNRNPAIWSIWTNQKLLTRGLSKSYNANLLRLALVMDFQNLLGLMLCWQPQVKNICNWSSV